MCLSIAIHRPHDILARGEHAGFEWIVTNNGAGYRCGYVKVGPGHPWHGADMGDLDSVEEDRIRVHGGITFAEHDEPCDRGGPDSGYWIGFDCHHCDDAPDPALPGYNEIIGLHRPDSRDVVRTQDYVEAECRSLCEQAARTATQRGGD